VSCAREQGSSEVYASQMRMSRIRERLWTADEAADEANIDQRVQKIKLASKRM
jgi:hypothetical protein